MKKTIREFLHRGLLFGGFGPIITGLIYMFVSRSAHGFSPTGTQMFVAILSTYLLAFLHAGASIFYQIEHWSTPKAMLFHFLTLYLAYTLCYLMNAWIPFKTKILLLYTASFIALYFIVWLIVYLCVRTASRHLNDKLQK